MESDGMPAILILHRRSIFEGYHTMYSQLLRLSLSARLLGGQCDEYNINQGPSLLLHFVQLPIALWIVANAQLVHLTADVRNHGALDTFSAFLLKSHLYKMKFPIKGNTCVASHGLDIVARTSIQNLGEKAQIYLVNYPVINCYFRT